MPFSAVCPGCRAVFELGEQAVGRTARCKRCQQIFIVAPPVSTSVPSPPRPELFAPAAEHAPSAVTSEPRRPRRVRPGPPQPEGLRLSPNARRSLRVALVVSVVMAVVVVMLASITGFAMLFRSDGDAKGRPNQTVQASRTVPAARGPAPR